MYLKDGFFPNDRQKVSRKKKIANKKILNPKNKKAASPAQLPYNIIRGNSTT